MASQSGASVSGTTTPDCGIHVFWTPLSPSEIFFIGKPVWILKSGSWSLQLRIINFWIQQSDSDQSLHGMISFVAGRTCGIMFLRLNVFHLTDIYGISTVSLLKYADQFATVLTLTNQWPLKNALGRWRLMPVLTVTCLLLTFHWQLAIKKKIIKAEKLLERLSNLN